MIGCSDCYDIGHIIACRIKRSHIIIFTLISCGCNKKNVVITGIGNGVLKGIGIWTSSPAIAQNMGSIVHCIKNSINGIDRRAFTMGV